MNIPSHLFHYFDRSTGPFKNLSLLSLEEATAVQEKLRRQDDFFSSKRDASYIEVRFHLETTVRREFEKTGGCPTISHPYTMTFGSCEWLRTWYPDPRQLSIPLSEFDPSHLSFTYGDIFPAFRWDDSEPHFRRVYLLHELPELIERHGLPQDQNPDGELGPKRYIEAQIWDETVIRIYSRRWHIEEA